MFVGLLDHGGKACWVQHRTVASQRQVTYPSWWPSTGESLAGSMILTPCPRVGPQHPVNLEPWNPQKARKTQATWQMLMIYLDNLVHIGESQFWHRCKGSAQRPPRHSLLRLPRSTTHRRSTTHSAKREKLEKLRTLGTQWRTSSDHEGSIESSNDDHSNDHVIIIDIVTMVTLRYGDWGDVCVCVRYSQYSHHNP